MTRSISNPERGCGHLKPGQAYVRGTVASPDGILPSFVKLDPFVPFREMGTDGQFTRGYVEFDGLTAQLALEHDNQGRLAVDGDDLDVEPSRNQGLATFERLYPFDETDDGDPPDRRAAQNMVSKGLYDDVDQVPDRESQRHIDRVRTRGVEDGDHWGEIQSVNQNDLMMRAGKTHYPDPQDFIDEAVEMGISKAIPLTKRQEPPTIQPGITRMWIVHPDTRKGWAVIGYAYLHEVVFTEPVDENVPQYVQDMEDAGKLEVVEIEDPPDAAEQSPDTGLDQFVGEQPASDGDDPGGQTAEDGIDDRRQYLIDEVNHNALRSKAASQGLELGQAPSKPDVVDALLDSDVDVDEFLKDV